MTDYTDADRMTGLGLIAQAVRRRYWVVLLCAVMVPAAALAYSKAQPKLYSARASILFTNDKFDQALFGSTVVTQQEDPTQTQATDSSLVALPVVAANTSAALHGRLSPAGVASAVTVAPEGQSRLVSITAVDSSPGFATELANTYGNQFVAFRQNADRAKISAARQLVQQQLSQLSPQDRASTYGSDLANRAEQLQILAALQTGNAELVQPATVPVSPSSPNMKRNLILGIVVGILLGLGCAVVLERLDRRLRTPSEASAAFGRPLLGVIPQTPALVGPLTEISDPAVAEAFRMLRANLRYFDVDREIRSVLVTSAGAGDGKSTVALHLAATAASIGSSVLLVESDLRKPTLARRLETPNDVGLSQVLSGHLAVDRAIVRVPCGDRGSRGAAELDVLLAGPVPPNPTDLIESRRMRELIQAAESRYDLVVIDTPPTSVVSDAIPLVGEVSGVIVVTRVGSTTRDAATHLRDQLQHIAAHMLGVVANGVTGKAGSGYGYAYGYGAPARAVAAYATAPAASSPDIDERTFATDSHAGNDAGESTEGTDSNGGGLPTQGGTASTPSTGLFARRRRSS